MHHQRLRGLQNFPCLPYPKTPGPPESESPGPTVSKLRGLPYQNHQGLPYPKLLRNRIETSGAYPFNMSGAGRIQICRVYRIKNLEGLPNQKMPTVFKDPAIEDHQNVRNPETRNPTPKVRHTFVSLASLALEPADGSRRGAEGEDADNRRKVQGFLAYKKRNPQDSTVGLCLGS